MFVTRLSFIKKFVACKHPGDGRRIKMSKKKKASIVDRSSVNYTFSNDTQHLKIFRQPDQMQDQKQEQKDPNVANKLARDLREQSRHKANSRKIKSMQNHSPVYE